MARFPDTPGHSTTAPIPTDGARSVSQRRRAGRRELVLRALKDATEPLGISTLAEQLQVHPNTVRFHLEALTGTGQVEQVPTTPTGPGRPAALFTAVPGMDPAGPTRYQVLARILAQDIATDADPRARAIAAGRRWGAQHKVARQDDEVTGLMHLLEDLDFDPESRPGTPEQVGLRHCPFLDLVPEYSTVICSLHLGLMQGAMQDSPTEVTDLVPFAQPDLCVAHVRQRP